MKARTTSPRERGFPGDFHKTSDLSIDAFMSGKNAVIAGDDYNSENYSTNTIDCFVVLRCENNETISQKVHLETIQLLKEVVPMGGESFSKKDVKYHDKVIKGKEQIRYKKQ